MSSPYATTLQATAQKLRLELQEWVWTTGLLTVAAGWVVGQATKQMIEGVLQALFLPLWAGLLAVLPGRGLLESVLAQSLGRAVRHVVLYGAIIALTFVVLELILGRRVFGVKRSATGGERVEFAKAKAAARADRVLVDEKEAKSIAARDVAERVVGQTLNEEEDTALLLGAVGSVATWKEAP